jgi:hypothetical protein
MWMGCLSMLAAMATDGSTPIGSSRYTLGMEGRLPNHGQPRLGLRNELVLDRQQYIAEGKKLIENYQLEVIPTLFPSMGLGLNSSL